MIIGDLVTSRVFGITGIVVSILDFGYKLHSYQGTMKILGNSGNLITLDVHKEDDWRVVK